MLKIFNSISKQKEDFVPISDKKVGMYVCGPTVYGPGHIGHARTYVAFDIIRKYLEFSGFDVNYVVNITDVHDDIIKRAKEQEITIFELADKNIELFFHDMNELGIKKATWNPRVTELISEIVEMIKTLQDRGYAYETEDGVYFDITKFEDYGKLSKIKIAESKTGTRVKTDKYDKENVQDFALWKKASEEPFWDSPWGKGRPGWHIECSVMSKKGIGDQIDIHGGAVDLVFPHHENEIAQSEAATGKKPFVKYWLHTGFLNVDGEKMSKSLGNFIIIPELLDKFDPKVFRFFIANVHYRSRIDFNDEIMESTKKSLERINRFLQSLTEIDVESGVSVDELLEANRKRFMGEMDDDFNTPNAMVVLHELMHKINQMINENKLDKNGAKKVLDFYEDVDRIFGIFTFEKERVEISQEIQDLVKKREQFRNEKKWAEADKIRDEIKDKGFTIFDTPEGTKLEKSA